ncbi:histidine phosphatase family protein [Lacticaseibacillus thailandensis]|uniref:Phosphoglycerate mutase family protein n=1 Tax=Lacticaseibacillus thailandensis DSM 22698 = JCM 13996 TaxID=1423810 RepID=A0A0R2CGZ8_9LACO|nr:histidine phosphatase family protein [Lacticaseibacillus thailandensis]KRM87500.1 phosphoglycerate mutase family protein [Lacticaseibacillus thailandensis DSM 22698 = JCM 13996]
MTYLYLVRHGQTVVNTEGRFNGGGVDGPLTAKGVAGAQAVHTLLQGIHFDRIVSSPLPRAVATARLVTAADAPIELDDRLREMSLGDWDGQLLAPWMDDPEFINYRHHMEHWNYRAVHAEGYQALLRRTRAAFNDLAVSVGPTGRALVVSHGIVLTVTANVLTGVPLDHARDTGEVANTSVTVLRTDGQTWTKAAWNVKPGAGQPLNF